MILLNDEEIWDKIGETSTTYEEDLQTIAKAQLKKVAEWGFGACPHNPENLQARRAYCPVCWQELLKEVEQK